MSLKRRFRILACVAIAAFSLPALAGGSEDFGNYVIHYNALTTDQLPPDVASAYGIVRSSSRAMLNISVTRKQAGTTGNSVKATVNVDAANLTGQVKNMRMREVVEPGDVQTIYYLGEVSVNDGETLVFTVRVTPAGESKTYEVKFRQQFFTN